MQRLLGDENPLETLKHRRILLSFPSMDDTAKGMTRDRLQISLEGGDVMVGGWQVFSSRSAALSVVREIGSFPQSIGAHDSG